MTRLKHVRLKITSVPCTQSELPVARWLAKEGFLQSESRLDQNRKDLETFNKGGHDLDWNRRVGKVPGAPDEGIITCRSCKLTWSWRYRHTTLKNSICKGPREPASTAHVRLDDPRPRPTRRLRSMSLPQVMLHPPRPPLLHGGVALDECFAKGALTLCAVALFPSLNFFGPLGLSGLSADKDVEVFKRPGGILDTHETNHMMQHCHKWHCRMHVHFQGDGLIYVYVNVGPQAP